MCANLLELDKDIKILKKKNIEYLHVDIMDGHFVDNITLGFDCCVYLKKYAIPRDIHLLVEKPSDFIERLELQSNDICQCHYETNADLCAIAKKIHEAKAKFGVVLNPETPIEKLTPFIAHIDVVTLMMIHPGFAGYPMENGMIEKILYSRKWLDNHDGKHIQIEVDGHVNTDNVPDMFQNGAELFVAGSSSIFRKDMSIEQGIDLLRESIFS